MKKIFCCFVLVLGLFMALSTPAIASEERMPASEVSLGGITYGSESSYVRSICGAPTKITTEYNYAQEVSVTKYSYNGSFIISFINDKVTFMQSTANNGIKTKQGIAVGSSFKELLNTYGNPISSFKKEGYDMYYFGNNIGYDVGYLIGMRGGKVARIEAGLFD